MDENELRAYLQITLTKNERYITNAVFEEETRKKTN
jgi:hypothetical protein